MQKVILAAAVTMLTACGGGPSDSSPRAIPVANTVPQINDVKITDINGGLLKPGDTLSVSYKYIDTENDAEGDSRIQWLLNNKIISAVSAGEYSVLSAQEGQQISARITPIAITGEAEGIATNSNTLTVAIDGAPFAENINIKNIQDRFKPGSVLTASYDYSDTENDSEDTSEIGTQYRWLRNGQTINDATALEYVLVVADEGQKLNFEVTPKAQSGTRQGPSFLSASIQVEANAGPLASAVKITDGNGDEPRVGDLLTGSYQYSDEENNAEGESFFRWLSTRNGVTTPITGAVTKNYQLILADEGAELVFEVTPVAFVGTTQGSAVRSEAISAAVNQEPTASDVSIIDINTGKPMAGDILRIAYTYTDSENDPEGDSIFSWHRNGVNIIGAPNQEYIITTADQGNTLTASVRPIPQNGNSNTQTVITSGLLIPDSVQEDTNKHLDGRNLTSTEKIEIDKRILDPSVVPSMDHPRLYGGESWNSFVANVESFDPNCEIGYINADRGSVINFKSMWDRVLYGKKACNSVLNDDLSLHNDAKHYYGVVDTTREEQEAIRLRVLHLIRRELACHDPEIAIACQFSITDRDTLIQKFYDAEITRLRTAPRFDPANPYHIPEWGNELGFPADYTFNQRWHRTNSAQFMVLEAAPAFKFWTLFLDILWNNPVLESDDKNYIQTELDYEISSYLKQNEEKHWTLHNGNNWTAVLNSAALHWAILNYYEQPGKSKKVLEAILESNWTHRDFYQQDGGYKEGGSYAIGTSYPYILTQNQLFMGAFKQPIHSFNWLLGEVLSNWLLNNMLSDSYLADFGDAHATQGMVSTMPLDLLLAKDMLSNEETDFPIVFKETNLCLIQKYFSNTYFDGPLNDPWRIHPVLFQNWPEIIKGCTLSEDSVKTEIFPISGFSIIESKRVTELGTAVTDENKFNLHANENQLLMTSTATNVDHREMDIGGLIWSAHGSRIFADFGYGKLVRNYHEYDLFTNFNDQYESHLDHVLGSSTLILPEAFKLSYTNYPNNGARYEYRGQIYSGEGSLSIETYGEFEAVALDASHAYSGKDEGKFDRPAVEGLLKDFKRWLVTIDENTVLIIDSIAAKDTAKTTAEEYFLLPHDDNKSCEKVLGSWSWNVEADIKTNEVVELTPNCNQLKESTPGTSDSVGLAHFKITAASLKGGGFTFEKPDYIANIPLFGDDALTTSAENQTVLSMLNITNRRTNRKLLRWKPQSEFTNDIRVFALQTALANELHKDIALSFSANGLTANVTGLDRNFTISFENNNGVVKISDISVQD